MSDDEARGAALAAYFPDVYLTRPGANRSAPPGTTPATHLLVLTGTDAETAIADVAVRLADDARLLLESADGSAPAVGGWLRHGERQVGGYRFAELSRGDDATGGPPPRAAQEGRTSPHDQPPPGGPATLLPATCHGRGRRRGRRTATALPLALRLGLAPLSPGLAP